mmetsp:Transcript_26311/g.81943  ORF Transcript_26311/g.81943 Transcript_26311/m.81943 type:complete len:268 (+) Transcript_26311:521-1324(+)
MPLELSSTSMSPTSCCDDVSEKVMSSSVVSMGPVRTRFSLAGLAVEKFQLPKMLWLLPEPLTLAPSLLPPGVAAPLPLSLRILQRGFPPSVSLHGFFAGCSAGIFAIGAALGAAAAGCAIGATDTLSRPADGNDPGAPAAAAASMALCSFIGLSVVASKELRNDFAAPVSQAATKLFTAITGQGLLMTGATASSEGHPLGHGRLPQERPHAGLWLHAPALSKLPPPQAVLPTAPPRPATAMPSPPQGISALAALLRFIFRVLLHFAL